MYIEREFVTSNDKPRIVAFWYIEHDQRKGSVVPALFTHQEHQRLCSPPVDLGR
jgi:hypothetical protein